MSKTTTGQVAIPSDRLSCSLAPQTVAHQSSQPKAQSTEVPIHTNTKLALRSFPDNYINTVSSG